MGRAQRRDQADVSSPRPLAAAVCKAQSAAGSLDATSAGSSAVAPGPGKPPFRDAAPAAAAPAGPSSSSGFDQRVYAAVALIPPGQLASYGQIAEAIGAWGCARQVGWALRRLPLPSPIPWHRVVNASGRISMTPSREGSDWIQRQLLLAEGIPVQPNGRLPLATHRWRAGVAVAQTSSPRG